MPVIRHNVNEVHSGDNGPSRVPGSHSINQPARYLNQTIPCPCSAAKLAGVSVITNGRSGHLAFVQRYTVSHRIEHNSECDIQTALLIETAPDN